MATRSDKSAGKGVHEDVVVNGEGDEREVTITESGDLDDRGQPHAERTRRESKDRTILVCSLSAVLIFSLGLIGYAVVTHRSPEELTAIGSATSPFVALSGVILAYYFSSSEK